MRNALLKMLTTGGFYSFIISVCETISAEHFTPSSSPFMIDMPEAMTAAVLSFHMHSPTKLMGSLTPTFSFSTWLLSSTSAM